MQQTLDIFAHRPGSACSVATDDLIAASPGAAVRGFGAAPSLRCLFASYPVPSDPYHYADSAESSPRGSTSSAARAVQYCAPEQAPLDAAAPGPGIAPSGGCRERSASASGHGRPCSIGHGVQPTASCSGRGASGAPLASGWDDVALWTSDAGVWASTARRASARSQHSSRQSSRQSAWEASLLREEASSASTACPPSSARSRKPPSASGAPTLAPGAAIMPALVAGAKPVVTEILQLIHLQAVESGMPGAGALAANAGGLPNFGLHELQGSDDHERGQPLGTRALRPTLGAAAKPPVIELRQSWPADSMALKPFAAELRAADNSAADASLEGNVSAWAAPMAQRTIDDAAVHPGLDTRLLPIRETAPGAALSRSLVQRLDTLPRAAQPAATQSENRASCEPGSPGAVTRPHFPRPFLDRSRTLFPAECAEAADAPTPVGPTDAGSCGTLQPAPAAMRHAMMRRITTGNAGALIPPQHAPLPAACAGAAASAPAAQALIVWENVRLSRTRCSTTSLGGGALRSSLQAAHGASLLPDRRHTGPAPCLISSMLRCSPLHSHEGFLPRIAAMQPVRERSSRAAGGSEAVQLPSIRLRHASSMSK